MVVFAGGLARFFVKCPADSCVVESLFLMGKVGTGKTCFARGFIQSILGEHTFVPSPTFTITQQYRYEKQRVFHYDLYRLHASDSFWDVDWHEIGTGGIALIEWPERVPREMLPENYWWLEFSVGANNEERLVNVTAPSDKSEADCVAHLQDLSCAKEE